MSPRWTSDPDIRRGRSIVSSLHVHLVFVTRYRRDVLDDDMLTACDRVMRDVCTQMGAELREFSGETGYVRLLVHYPPKLPVSTLVNRLKGVSTHYLRKEFTGRVSQHLIHGHLWSPSYFAASCGGAPLAIIKEYIEQQKGPGQTDAIPPGSERPGFLASHR
jgi:putative transposase